MPRPARLPLLVPLALLAAAAACGPSDFGRGPGSRGASEARGASGERGGIETALADTAAPGAVVADQDTALRSTAGTGVLIRFNLKGAPTRQVELPPALDEISGIAFDARGRLFAHGDETGTIWRLDPATGRVLARFALTDETGDGKGAGKGAVHADFEDIQVVGDRIWLVTSDGVLYETREGADGERVPFTRYDTGLGKRCEVEGLTFDASTDALLLLCKHARTKAWDREVIVLGFPLDRKQLEATPRIAVPFARLAPLTGEKAFHGSAFVRAPRSGNLVLIAGPQRAYAEVSSTGQVLGGGQLDRKYHRQPEGIAFAPDGSLLISDEAAGKRATVAAYTAKP
ncbi:MAG TPA: hypothetical protein VFS40_03740 [Gemmatimonadales bacterium]|nr:hypothetical protein [Gemmatimonadales bacterium]